MEENRDNVSVQERTSNRNLSHRTRYAQMSLERKELFLSQLREKRVESKRQKLRHQSNSTGALTITTSSLSPQQVEASEATNLPVTSTRGERIVNCLSTFEVGMEENRDNVSLQERTSDRNLRRRTRYARISPKRKELFLSQLRERRAESKRQKLHQSNSIGALTINTSSLSPQQVEASEATTLAVISTTGERIVNCLSTFEVAKRFQYESPGFCCDNGSIRLTFHNMPTELRNLFFGDSKESQHFRTYSRAYNNMFAFTSLGVHYDRGLAKRNHGIYTFKVQGQMYHFIDDLIPSGGKRKNLQLYFYDNKNELTNRMTLSDNLNEVIVTKLMDILKVNPYSTFLRSLTVVPNLSEFYIA
ncbi:hypothetical protein H5410_044739 [Solanum commersonii]|uniref:Uncharacterized protein n=1 Tax=Solanum commersonii TaxID=4109 RepID=A0A9J5X7M5_SOLCO|nr:hypothetical protein H5410_044739 [Solanum commersonii]